MEAALISYYTEISVDNKFKSRAEYDIDWQKMIDISKEYGYISSTECFLNNTMTRITIWSDINSYSRWLKDEYVQRYIQQRDSHNIKNNIVSYTSMINLCEPE